MTLLVGGSSSSACLLLIHVVQLSFVRYSDRSSTMYSTCIFYVFYIHAEVLLCQNQKG